MVLESRLRKLTHTHTHAFSFHEHSLKSVRRIMGLLAISEKTIVFEVWRVLGEEKISRVCRSGWYTAMRLWVQAFLTAWIQGKMATHTVYPLADQSIMKIKSENSALEGNRIQKRLSQI